MTMLVRTSSQSDLEPVLADDTIDVRDLAGKSLDDLAAEARAWKETAENHERAALHANFELARRLKAAKSRMKLPEFEVWVIDQVGIHWRQAYSYMELVRPAGLQRAANLAPGSSLRGALQALREMDAEERSARPRQERLSAVTLPPSLAIEQADCADLPMGDEIADLIVTSPPYGLGLDGVDTTDGYVEYLNKAAHWAQEMFRVAGPNGRLCLNVPLDTTRDVPVFMASDWWRILGAVGWQFRHAIVWNEGSINHRTGWGSFGSPNAPHVIAPVEVVLVVHKGEWNLLRSRERSDTTDEEFIAWTNGLWDIPNRKHPWHPAPFPEELARRLVKLYSYPGDVVLDPFCGSGTASVMAYRLGRRAYGFDINQEWVARARVDAEWTVRDVA